jgi:hypothetical protein
MSGSITFPRVAIATISAPANRYGMLISMPVMSSRSIGHMR